MPSTLVNTCSKMLADKGLKIAFAESATAGRLAYEFSLTEYSGQVLLGGLVSYDAAVKKKVLQIPDNLLEKYTPESNEVTEAMARQLATLIPSDIQVAVTGLTTPGGTESDEKPVGTIFIHILIGTHSVPVRKVFEGGPDEIVVQAIDLVAARIIEILEMHRDLA